MERKRTDKKKLSAARAVAALYYDFKASVDKFENGEINNITAEKLYTYQENKRYMEAIEETFNHSINSYNKEKVWAWFYSDKKPQAHEERQLKSEIERWMYYLSKELGYETM